MAGADVGIRVRPSGWSTILTLLSAVTASSRVSLSTCELHLTNDAISSQKKIAREIPMKLPYIPSCLPSHIISDEITTKRLVANIDRLRNCDDASLAEIFLHQPLETLVNRCESLKRDQIASVPDDIYDQFVRLRPAGACRFTSWRLSDPQIAYCLERYPWDILVHAPFLLSSAQLSQCVIDFPDIALIHAAKYLDLDDLVSLCISHGPLADEALSENAHRLSPEQFGRLLHDSSAIEAIALMVTYEDLVDSRIVFDRLFEACNGLSESELDQVSPVFRAIGSMV